MKGVWHILTRRKVLDETNDLLKPSKLARHLATYDLVALGVGSTLGVGVYVLAGHVARDAAGPSVILSFLIAAIASLFAGLCYAEFGARVPKAGSAYIYSYVCVGEFIAFIIGWNLILEYVIGSASVSRGISLYLDTLINDTLKTTFREIAPINVSFMSDYFDLLAFSLAFFLGGMLAFGLKESTNLNNIFTVLNVCIVIFVIVAGAFKADIDNWNIVANNTMTEYNVGNGGFFPFGFAGTLKGAATCFFGFVGFDCIATTGEEVHNPKKAIPLSIVISLGIIFLAYFGISTVLTLMWPYYLQDANAPIPHVFGEVGWTWAKWIVVIGGIFGLLASLFGSLFPLPRILYAMATDGLVFRFFGDVSTRFHTPVVGTLLAALLTGIMAGLFELSHLVNMMSIGTLMAYTIVAACVLLLRFESSTTMPVLNGDIVVHETSYLMNQHKKFSIKRALKQLCNCTNNARPDKNSSVIVGTLITFYCLFCVAFGLCLMYLINQLESEITWAIVLTSIFGLLMVLCVLLIYLQPKSKTELSFQVPCVPLVPCISIFINIYLMLMLDTTTWIRFGIWMAVGIPIYIASLYIYKRGGNYLMYAQKSSFGNDKSLTLNGKLNYAFENSMECQERATSFVPDYIEDRKPMAIPRITSGVPEYYPEKRLTKTIELNEVKSNGFSHEHDMHVMKSLPSPITDDEFVMKMRASLKSASLDEGPKTSPQVNDDDKIANYEEIELLDQVIKDEEEASGMSPVLDRRESETTPPVLDPSLNPSSEFPCDLSNGDGSDQRVLSEHSVVAMVHRENTVVRQKDPHKSSDEHNINKLDQMFDLPISSSDLETNGVAKNNDENSGEKSDDKVEGRKIIDDNEFPDDDSGMGKQVDVKLLLKLDPPKPKVLTDEVEEVVKQTNGHKEEESEPYIPPPPPFDEKYFSKTLPIARFKVVKYNKDVESDRPLTGKQKRIASFKKADDDPIISSVSTSDVEEDILKFGTHKQNVFMHKLDFILSKNKKRPSARGAAKSVTDEHLGEEQAPRYVQRHMSEPDIVALSRREKELENDSSTNDLTNKSNDNSHDVNSNKSDSEDESETMSKENIKSKLEALFSSSKSAVPPTVRRKNWNKVLDTCEADAENNAQTNEEETNPEIIKPKKKDNYTNTMKLQRARFGDVLKSIEMKNRRDSELSLENNPVPPLASEESVVTS